jgi:hypothetical protein
MKRIISSISLLAVFIFLFSSCEKKDILQDVNNLGRGSYVKLIEKNSGIIDFNNLGGTKATAKVSEYGEPQAKLIVYVSKGNRTTDRTQWKKVKEYANNGGEYLVEVSGTEIATAMGGTIAPGDLYTLYNSVETTDGKRFDYGNIETGVASSPNYNFALTFDAVIVCPFTGNMAGSYKVIRDDWVDWSPGDIVQITDGPGANQVNISAVWPNPAYGSIINPLYIIVTPATGAATVPNNYTWGNYGSYNTNTNGVGSGFVFSCTGDINMSIPTFATGFGNQGALKLILKKL